MSSRSVLNVIGSTDMDVKSGLTQLQGGAKSISLQQCRGGAAPVQTRAYHLSRDQVHKLLLRKNQCHVQKLQLFKLEGDSTKPEEIDDLTPEGIYDYYARFCTCERTIATQYYPDNKDPVTDLIYKTHTFAPCPVNNVAALIARHLDTDLYPRTDVVYEYAKVVVPLMRELSKRIARDNQLFQYDIPTHLQHYPEAKRNAIIHGIRSIYTGSKMVKTLKCFVKTGEWQQNDPYDFAQGKRVGRSRQIWGPSDILKALPGWINMLYLKRAKSLVPGIICGYSQDALSQKLTSDRLALCARWGMDFVKVLCYDASSHDAHQWWPLMEVVDVVLFQHINLVFDVYGIPSDVRIKVLDAITSKDFVGECFVKLGETTFKQYSITISGTTYSGHPTRTTLGNSLRTISFIVYNVYRLFGLKEAAKVFWGTSELLIVYVAGDDVMIQGQADAVLALSRALIHTHCTNVTHGSWGLGQCAREVIVGDWDFVDFLSRDGYFFEVMRVTRKTDRVVTKSNWAFNLPKVNVWNSKVGRTVLKAIRILNWSIAVQQLVWARGITIFENMMSRRLLLGEAPTAGSALKYCEATIRSSAMNIGSDQMDHVNQESWHEMMRRKYGATYAHLDLADKGLMSHKSDFVSKSLIR